jgi:hypothetical protein
MARLESGAVVGLAEGAAPRPSAGEQWLGTTESEPTGPA